MAINPSIAMAGRGLELPDPLAQYGRLAAIQGQQNQNALAQYQLAAAQRADAQNAERMNALKAAGTDVNKIGNALLESRDLKGYADWMKSMSEQGKATAEQKKANSEFINQN